jgi:hypothetical protein
MNYTIIYSTRDSYLYKILSIYKILYSDYKIETIIVIEEKEKEKV